MTPRMLLAQALSLNEDQVGDDFALNQQPRWDSLAHVEVVSLAEQHWGIPITEESITKLSSFRGIAEEYARWCGSLESNKLGS